MSRTTHDAIVVTYWDESQLKLAHQKAIELGLPVSDLVASSYNGHHSFLIAPDGSKDGWEPSDRFEAIRADWKDWVIHQLPHLQWVHVSYDEEYSAQLVDYAHPPEDDVDE